MNKIYLKKLMLSSKNLKTEIRVAFGLIAVAILVLLGYVFPGTESFFGARGTLPLVVAIALFILALGFLIILHIIDPVIKISQEAKAMASGDFEREIIIARQDEIGQLGGALNQMTRRIKDNVEELKDYSKKAEVINLEINRRIITFSSLVEISNLIAQNANIEEVFHTSLDKCLEFGTMTSGCLILKARDSGEFEVAFVHAGDNEQTEEGLKSLQVKLGQGVLGKTILKQDVTVIDKSTNSNDEVAEFRKDFNSTNAFLAPITSKGNVFGLLVLGNSHPDYQCTDTEKEVFFLVAKQIAIAITNELLKKEIEKLEVTDGLTGLFNNTYTRKRLADEIKRASGFHQPCSFALFSIDKFSGYNKAFGHIASENMLIKISNIFREHISREGNAARFGDHEFALILPERNKRESIKSAEEIIKAIKEVFQKEPDSRKRLTCSGAIAENPIDGVTADELILRSGVLLAQAMQEGGDKLCY